MTDDTSDTSNAASTSKWSSRKFWLVVGTTLIVTVLLWNSKIDQTVFQNLCWLLVGGYLLGNVSQNVLISKEK